MSNFNRTLSPFVLVALCASFLVASCGVLSGDDASTDGAESSVDFETDLDALRELYPLGDLAVTDVRWRYHSDFVATSDSSLDLPVQDAERIVEAVFRFEDTSIREALLAGRLTTVSDIPAWYPDELVAPESVTIAVSRNVADLPGIVSVFPDFPEFVRVTYTP